MQVDVYSGPSPTIKLNYQLLKKLHQTLNILTTDRHFAELKQTELNFRYQYYNLHTIDVKYTDTDITVIIIYAIFR